MNSHGKRISRLAAILTHLQGKRVVTAPDLAGRFSVSTRTIYRDIKALEEAGVPIITENGKGYSLMEGYCIPPVMFTESEALALITAEQLVLANRDTSFIHTFTNATTKIKAVLSSPIKEKTRLLENRIQIRPGENCETSSNHLSTIQLALTNAQLVKIEYLDAAHHITTRTIEPFALYNDGKNWILFAFCRLRDDFRAFRLDRIRQLNVLDVKFTTLDMTLRVFFEKHYATPDS